MKRRFSSIGVIFLTFLLIVLTGCGDQKTTMNQPKPDNKVQEVTIGVLYPTSGEYARFGVAALNAVKMATDDINAAGGIKSLGGAKLKLEIRDPGSDIQTTRSATENLITNKSISAITGDYSSSLSIVTSEVAERAEIPFVTASTANKITTSGFKYIFQLTPLGSIVGRAQAEFAKKILIDEKGLPVKAAIVFENTSYGQSVSDGVRQTAKELGIEVVLYEPYQAKFADASPLVTKIKASGANVLFPISYLQDSILIQKAIKQMDVKVITIGGGGGFLLPDYYQALGKDAEGVISVALWNGDVNKPGIEGITKRYQDKYGEFPSDQTGAAYSSMWVIAKGIENAASTVPKKIRDAMSTLKLEAGYPGDIIPGDSLEFDQTGRNKNAHPIMVQWQDGLLRTIYPATDAKGKLRL